MAVLPPLLSPPALLPDPLVSAVELVLDGLADPVTAAEVGLEEASFVGERTEVMMITDGVCPGTVAEGVMTMIDVWTSVSVGAADGAVMIEVGAGADDAGGAALEAGGFDEAGGAADDWGRLTALDAGGAADEGASEAWLEEGEAGLEEGAAEGAVEGVTDGKGGEEAAGVDCDGTRLDKRVVGDVPAVALLEAMLTTIARREGSGMFKVRQKHQQRRRRRKNGAAASFQKVRMLVLRNAAAEPRYRLALGQCATILLCLRSGVPGVVMYG